MTLSEIIQDALWCSVCMEYNRYQLVYVEEDDIRLAHMCVRSLHTGESEVYGEGTTLDGAIEEAKQYVHDHMWADTDVKGLVLEIADHTKKDLH